MRKWLSALTLVEVLVVIAIVSILALFFLPVLSRARGEAGAESCKENLSQIGKAIYAYTQNNSEYFPFIWGPATGEGAPSSVKGNPVATTACCDAATSIGCLYPQYLPGAKSFKCPATEDVPSFMMIAPYVSGKTPATATNTPYLFSERTWSLMSANPDKGWGASYGYDCRIYPSAVSNHAMLADLDGSWQVNHDTKTQNHADGQNVLYVDGAVRWQETNYVSNDPIDNIYAEGGGLVPGKTGATRVYWNADTDSFVVRGSVLLGLSWREYSSLAQ